MFRFALFICRFQCPACVVARPDQLFDRYRPLSMLRSPSATNQHLISIVVASSRMRGLHAAGSASSSILWLGAAAAATLLVQTATAAGSTGQSKLLPGHSRLRTSSLEDRPKECPPCFDCHLPRFNCLNSGKCNEYDGQCICQPGFGGLDCGIPLGEPESVSSW